MMTDAAADLHVRPPRPAFVLLHPAVVTITWLVGTALSTILLPPPYLVPPFDRLEFLSPLPSFASAALVTTFQAAWMLRVHAFAAPQSSGSAPALIPWLMFAMLVLSELAAFGAIGVGAIDWPSPVQSHGLAAYLVITVLIAHGVLLLLAAHALAIAEKADETRRKAIAYFVAMSVWPVGIWFLHPRLERLADARAS